MPTFIKTGFWEKLSDGYRGWLNLDDLIRSLMPTSSSAISFPIVQSNAIQYITDTTAINIDFAQYPIYSDELIFSNLVSVNYDINFNYVYSNAVRFPQLVNVNGLYINGGIEEKVNILEFPVIIGNLNTYLSFQQLGITTFDLNSLILCNGISLYSCNSLTTVDLSNLTSANGLTFSNCDLLTTIDLSSFINIIGVDNNFNFSDNSLSEITVNDILSKMVATDFSGVVYLSLDGGTNAAPTGQGLIDKATLESRGWIVTTN